MAGAAALALQGVAAQTGTPEAGEEVEFLFVQPVAGGTLTESDQGYTLSFRHDTGQTIYFSDRPERITGLLPTAELVAQWPFEDESPPNAALAISNADDASPTVFVGVLSDPTWDAATATLSYGFLMLADDIPAGSPTPVPTSFDSATLFIDASGPMHQPIIVVNMSGQDLSVVLDRDRP
jgi:hypothetical protein